MHGLYTLWDQLIIVKIINCKIDFGTRTLSTQISDSYVPIVMNNSATSLSTAGTFNNIEISGNSILGGHNGIYMSGTVASSVQIHINNNIVDSVNRYGR